MTKIVCPGQDTRFWRPGDIFDVPCAGCGKMVEFFKDEASRKCPHCGTRLQNPRLSMGCAQWCEHAKECLGFDPKQLSQDLAEAGEDQADLVHQLTAAMKKQFGNDTTRIAHALNVLGFARELLRTERVPSPKVVLAAALLHDIGIQEAEAKHGSSAGVYQEQEGPPIAQRIMKDLGLDETTIVHVCQIIANHHSDRGINSPEFKVLWDADWLVNLPEVFPNASREELEQKIAKIMKTEAGKKKAQQLFLQQKE